MRVKDKLTIKYNNKTYVYYMLDHNMYREYGRPYYVNKEYSAYDGDIFRKLRSNALATCPYSVDNAGRRFYNDKFINAIGSEYVYRIFEPGVQSHVSKNKDSICRKRRLQ